MSKQRKETKNIFRYKFNNIFIALIEAYANTHRYDDTVMFYDSWQEWVKDNEDVIEREQMRLKLLGYDGDFNAKMYKSARYYFKNKSLEKKPAIKRRRYKIIISMCWFKIFNKCHSINMCFHFT